MRIIQGKKATNHDLYRDEFTAHIPSVIVEDEPRIRIYDANGKSYWFTKIGFNRRINDND